MSVSVAFLSPALTTEGASEGFISSMKAQVVLDTAFAVEDFWAPRALAAPDFPHSPSLFILLVVHRVLFSLDWLKPTVAWLSSVHPLLRQGIDSCRLWLHLMILRLDFLFYGLCLRYWLCLPVFAWWFCLVLTHFTNRRHDRREQLRAIKSGSDWQAIELYISYWKLHHLKGI